MVFDPFFKVTFTPAAALVSMIGSVVTRVKVKVLPAVRSMAAEAVASTKRISSLAETERAPLGLLVEVAKLTATFVELGNFPCRSSLLVPEQAARNKLRVSRPAKSRVGMARGLSGLSLGFSC